MAKKVTYQVIKDYVESKNCKLVTTEVDFQSLREEFITLDKFNLEYICNCGNHFECNFSRFRNANKITCNECSTEVRSSQKRKSIEQIKKIISLDGSGCKLLEDEYKNTKTKMLFQCDCGETFITSWENYYYRNVRTCEKCRKLFRKEHPNKKWDYDSVLEFVRVNGNGSKLLSKEYKNYDLPLLFECRCGNKFSTTLDNFIRANTRQCLRCGHDTGSDKQKRTIPEIKKYIKDNKLTCKLLSTESKRAKDLLAFECSCGNIFYRSWDSMNRYRNEYCNECNCSKGERKIIDYIKENKIIKMKEYIFPELTSDYGKYLRFDFAIFRDILKTDLRILIEYDGEYHYEPILGEEALGKQQYHDKLKDDYCILNKILLIRIPYWDFDNIRIILEDILINNNLKSKYIIQNSKIVV